MKKKLYFNSKQNHQNCQMYIIFCLKKILDKKSNIYMIVFVFDFIKQINKTSQIKGIHDENVT